MSHSPIDFTHIKSEEDALAFIAVNIDIHRRQIIFENIEIAESVGASTKHKSNQVKFRQANLVRRI
jgi:hypothetical protein